MFLSGSSFFSNLLRFVFVLVCVEVWLRIDSTWFVGVPRELFGVPQQAGLEGVEFRAKVRKEVQTPWDTYYYSAHGVRRLRPHLNLTIKEATLSGNSVIVRTNSLGFRARELEASADPFVVVLGEERSFGAQINQSLLFSSELERYLKNAGFVNAFVLNAAVPGNRIRSYSRLLRYISSIRKPDVVIVCFGLSEHHAERYIEVPGLVFPFSRSWVFAHAWDFVHRSFGLLFEPIAHADENARMLDWFRDLEGMSEREPGYQNWIGSGVPFPDYSYPSPIHYAQGHLATWGANWSEVMWRSYVGEVISIAKEIVELSELGIVTVLPLRWQFMSTGFDYPNRRISRMLQSNLHYLDLISNFKERGDVGDLFLEQKGDFLSVRGHQTVGEVLGREILSYIEGNDS